ncbi:hypothetical protein JCGZ_27067 [Jatropha curcas]|uniref:Uncharacterized protein n=1 Tax=Jatropha curcas TaxID=180498 RepID=A0A067JJ73_JATCU|nr:hypothetical protein JCGZ_27067 [Jatropha curcas]
MAESSSNSSSNSLTEQEFQLLKKLSKKYEQKESKEKKLEEEPKKGKIETATSRKQVARASNKGRLERELIEEHNKELDEAIQHCKIVIRKNQSLIETLERMKEVNARKLATLRVKGTPYIPLSEKPKKVKHTAGKHRTYGRKPPLHPSSKRPESSSKTVPAQNLRSSKRLRTDSKPL